MKHFLLLLSLILVLGCSKPKNQFEIEFNIDGIQDNHFALLLNFKDFSKRDTMYSDGNKFYMKGIIEEPTRALLYVDSINSINFYIEPGKIKLNTSIETIRNNNYLPHKNLKAGINNKQFYEFHIKRKEQGMNSRQERRDSDLEILLSQPITTFTLDELSLREDFTHPAQQYQKDMYSKLSETLKNTRNGKLLGKLVSGKYASEGSPYIDITGQDLEGNPIKISDYSGKVILLSFWASWCKPCVKKMKTEYPIIREKYNNQNFEILSFSLDSEYESWKDKSADLDLDWTNFSNLEGAGIAIQNPVILDYNIGPIPVSFLIDQNGTVIKRIEFSDFALDFIDDFYKSL